MAELLCLGQVDNASAPNAAAGEIYFKSDSGFGSSYGSNDVLMLFETQDFAPLGQTGRIVARRLYVSVEFAGSVSVRITPITDFGDEQFSHTESLIVPSGARSRKVLEAPFAKPCTYVRARVEVLARTGLFWLQGVKLAYRPLTSSYEQVAGEE
jgi:hypothetical protein